MDGRNARLVEDQVVLVEILFRELLVSLLIEQPLMEELFKPRRVVEGVSGQKELLPQVLDFDRQTRNRVEGVIESKYCPEDVVLVSNFYLSKLEQILQFLLGDLGLNRVLPQVGVHDGLRGHELYWRRLD